MASGAICLEQIFVSWNAESEVSTSLNSHRGYFRLSEIWLMKRCQSEEWGKSHSMPSRVSQKEPNHYAMPYTRRSCSKPSTRTLAFAAAFAGSFGQMCVFHNERQQKNLKKDFSHEHTFWPALYFISSLIIL